MKNYEKPVVTMNENTSEGVYLASGEPECWTINPKSVQDWNGSAHVFEIECQHSTKALHLSNATTVTLTFNMPLVNAYSEFPATFSGSTVTVVRTLLADSYHAGDRYTFKVWAQAGDEASTKALAVTGATIRCEKAINVQGKGGDEI